MGGSFRDGPSRSVSPPRVWFRLVWWRFNEWGADVGNDLIGEVEIFEWLFCEPNENIMIAVFGRSKNIGMADSRAGMRMSRWRSIGRVEGAPGEEVGGQFDT